jgi:hypothetical protein
MNTTSDIPTALLTVFERPSGGVIGLVDDLLRLCPEQGLQLTWQHDCCVIRSLAANTDEVLERPLPKSVFRAMLARVATLCNERNADAVSPFGGQCNLSIDADSPTVLQITFTNTAAEQKVELVPMPRNAD